VTGWWTSRLDHLAGGSGERRSLGQPPALICLTHRWPIAAFVQRRSRLILRHLYASTEPFAWRVGHFRCASSLTPFTSSF